MEIGKSIARIRKAKGYSQAQIAEKLQTTQQQYSKYETGRQEIPARIIKKLSEIFNESANKLIGNEIYMTERDTKNAFLELFNETKCMILWAEDNKYITEDAMKLIIENLEDLKKEIEKKISEE